MAPGLAASPLSGRVAPMSTRALPGLTAAFSPFLSLQARPARSGSATARARRRRVIGGSLSSSRGAAKRALFVLADLAGYPLAPLAAGARHLCRAHRRDVRVDDGGAAVGLVLLDDEEVVGLLPVRGREAEHPARHDRGHLQRRELIAHQVAVDRAGVLDGGEQRPRRLVGEGLFPVGLFAVLGLVGVEEILHQRLVADARAPEARDHHVIGSVGAEQVAVLPLQAARAVALYFVAQPSLQIF